MLGILEHLDMMKSIQTGLLISHKIHIQDLEATEII